MRKVPLHYVKDNFANLFDGFVFNKKIYLCLSHLYDVFLFAIDTHTMETNITRVTGTKQAQKRCIPINEELLLFFGNGSSLNDHTSLCLYHNTGKVQQMTILNHDGTSTNINLLKPNQANSFSWKYLQIAPERILIMGHGSQDALLLDCSAIRFSVVNFQNQYGEDDGYDTSWYPYMNIQYIHAFGRSSSYMSKAALLFNGLSNGDTIEYYALNMNILYGMTGIVHNSLSDELGHAFRSHLLCDTILTIQGTEEVHIHRAMLQCRAPHVLDFIIEQSPLPTPNQFGPSRLYLSSDKYQKKTLVTFLSFVYTDSLELDTQEEDLRGIKELYDMSIEFDVMRLRQLVEAYLRKLKVSKGVIVSTEKKVDTDSKKGKLVVEGDVAFRKKDFIKAAMLYTQALTLGEPDKYTDLIALDRRCATYIQAKNYVEALKDAKQLLEMSPESIEGHYRSGVIHSKLENLWDAVVSFAAAIEIRTSDINIEKEFLRALDRYKTSINSKFPTAEWEQKLHFLSRNHISRSIVQLVNDPLYADFFFVFNSGERVPAHRFVLLLASEFFSNMPSFSADDEPGEPDSPTAFDQYQLNIDDMIQGVSKETFLIVLEWMYTRSIYLPLLSLKQLSEVVPVADFFGLSSLVLQIEHCLIASIKFSPCEVFRIASDNYSFMPRLMHRVLDFLSIPLNKGVYVNAKHMDKELIQIYNQSMPTPSDEYCADLVVFPSVEMSETGKCSSDDIFYLGTANPNGSHAIITSTEHGRQGHLVPRIKIASVKGFQVDIKLQVTDLTVVPGFSHVRSPFHLDFYMCDDNKINSGLSMETSLSHMLQRFVQKRCTNLFHCTYQYDGQKLSIGDPKNVRSVEQDIDGIYNITIIVHPIPEHAVVLVMTCLFVNAEDEPVLVHSQKVHIDTLKTYWMGITATNPETCGSTQAVLEWKVSSKMSNNYSKYLKQQYHNHTFKCLNCNQWAMNTVAPWCFVHTAHWKKTYYTCCGKSNVNAKGCAKVPHKRPMI
jgi:tetratricopeptide (TPR) repeat protein